MQVPNGTKPAQAITLFSFERSISFTKNKYPFKGALAQLGERLPCTQEVIGSIPLGSMTEEDETHSALFHQLTHAVNS